jgi:hypothetical protein
MPKKIKWTKQMDRYLRCYYHRKSAMYLAGKLELSKSAVLRRARSLNITSKYEAGTAQKSQYSEGDISFIRENIVKMGAKNVANELNRSPESVRKKAYRIGIRLGTRNKPLSEKEQQILKDNIETKTYRELAKLLNRGEEETRWHARKLGLSRLGRNTKKPRQTS